MCRVIYNQWLMTRMIRHHTKKPLTGRKLETEIICPWQNHPWFHFLPNHRFILRREVLQEMTVVSSPVQRTTMSRTRRQRKNASKLHISMPARETGVNDDVREEMWQKQIAVFFFLARIFANASHP